MHTNLHVHLAEPFAIAPVRVRSGAPFMGSGSFDNHQSRRVVPQNNIRSNIGGAKSILAPFCMWAPMPGVPIPSLHGPILFARTTFP